MNEFAKALLSETRNPAIPDDKDIFGPLIGTWDFEWRDGDDPEGEPRGLGEWIFHRVLDGMAVQDIFICPSRATRALNRQADASYGTTLRIYNPLTETWDIFYGETNSATRLTAVSMGNEIVLTEINGRKKWVFSEITPNSFCWRHFTADDSDVLHLVGGLRAVRRK